MKKLITVTLAMAVGVQLLGACNHSQNKNVREIQAATAECRWNKATDTVSPRYLFVYDKQYDETVAMVVGTNRIIDYMKCDGMEVTDAVLAEYLKNMLIDYRYQQVSLIFKGTENLDAAQLNAALQKLVDVCHAYAPLAEIHFFNGNALMRDAFDGLKAKNCSPAAAEDDALFIALQDNTDKPPVSMNYKKNADATPDADLAEYCEEIEWTKARINYKNAENKILLIGDSISEGYGPTVEAELGAAYAVSYLRTSRGAGDKALLRELDLLLGALDFGIIHFNIGLHKHKSTADAYADKMKYLIDRMKAKESGAKLLFANTTTYSKVSDEGIYEFDEAASIDIQTRNALMKQICLQKSIPYLDLFDFVNTNDIPKKDAVHFFDYTLIGKTVKEFIVSNHDE